MFYMLELCCCLSIFRVGGNLLTMTAVFKESMFLFPTTQADKMAGCFNNRH